MFRRAKRTDLIALEFVAGEIHSEKRGRKAGKQLCTKTSISN